MVFKIRLEDDEKSLQELLALAEKRKLDIENLPISDFTSQYLSYLESKKPDMEETTQFFLAASKLLSLKVKTLMPSLSQDIEEEEDFEIAEQLAQHLMEYRTFKEAAVLFQQRLDEEQSVYVRRGEINQYVNSISSSNMLEGIELADLVNALEKVLQKDVFQTDRPYEVPKQEFKVAEKMDEIICLVQGKGDLGIDFENLFPHQTVKGEIIATFLALLELVRLRKVRISQNKTFGKIIVFSA